MNNDDKIKDVAAKAVRRVDDLQERRLTAAKFFSDPEELDEVFFTIKNNRRALHHRERRVERAIAKYAQEDERTFVSVYALYLAYAHDLETAKTVDERCRGLERMLPELSDRIVHTYVSKDPLLIERYGPALVGAALKCLTPYQLYDELVQKNLSLETLAADGEVAH